MKLRTLLMGAVMALATVGATSANASTVVLNFEGVGDGAQVNDFYNGGTDSAGHSGANYGINFSGNSLGIFEESSNAENEPSPHTLLYYLSGSAATMNVAAGFDTGFSFFYSSNTTAFINVYEGLNATGAILATLSLAQQFNVGCAPGSTKPYCNWTPIGVTFAGTAHSVDFGGGANYVGYDDITLGSATAGGGSAVPEPSTWALLISGFGLAGAALRRRRLILA